LASNKEIGKRIEIPVPRERIIELFGPNDSNLRFLEDHFQAVITAREESILIPDDDLIRRVMMELIEVCNEKNYLEIRDIETILRLNRVNSNGDKKTVNDSVVLENVNVSVKSRTVNQAVYMQAMQHNELVFAIGPAGTGKTFLAVAHAVNLYERGDVEKIVLVKPVVEAGEKLGFLPGDIREKVDPYFKPLYDALHYMMSPEKVNKLIDQNIIEISPLAFMRGRTLNYAAVILDEAQNTTAMQMKMFLTRMGAESQAVVTGDLTQIDLENPQMSGLLKIQDILIGIEGIRFVYLDSGDVIRHRLVSDIIKAYGRNQGNEKS